MSQIIREFFFNVNFQEDKFERADGNTEVITIVENDNKSTKFKFDFEEEIQDGTNILVKIKHNTGFVKDYVLCIENKKAELTLTNSIIVAGTLKMTISLIGEDNEILTPTQFQNKILVREAITGKMPIPEDDSRLLEGLISQVNVLKAETKKTIEQAKDATEKINEVIKNVKSEIDESHNVITEIQNKSKEIDEKTTQNTKSIQTNRTDINKILSEYITKAVNDLQNYYLKEEIDEKISSIPKFSIEVVETFPTENISTTTIYLVLTGEETDNIYTEYIYTDKWEKLGTQKIDLTNYYTISQITELLKKKASTESIPTKTSDLENDSKFIKETELNESQQTQDTKIQKLLDETEELIEQMPWSTTEKAESIRVEDSAKYSRNRLNIFGNLYQKTRKGYNLIDTSSFTDRTVNGMTFTRKDDGTILINGTSTQNTGFQVSVDFTISAGDYTTYIPYSKNTPLTIALGYNGSIPGTNIQPTSKTGENAHYKQITFTEDTKVNQLRFYIPKDSTITNYVLKWMLIKGKYTADTIPEYEQYGVMPSRSYPSVPEVATGVQKLKRFRKNWLDTQKNASITSLGVTVSTDKDGIITINGTTEGKGYLKLYSLLEFLTYSNFQKKDKKYFEKGIYNMSFKYISGSKNGNNTNLYIRSDIASANTSYSLEKHNEKDINVTFELTENGKYIVYDWIDTGITFNNYKFEVQIEKVKNMSDTATDYEPYAENAYTLNLGSTGLYKIKDKDGNIVAQDRAVYRKVDEVWKWQWEKNVKKRVFNGTEEWQTASAYEGFYCYSLNLNEDGLTDSATKNTYGLNTHFTQRIEQSNDGYEYLLIQTNPTKGTAYIQTKDLATLADFKAYLSQNNVSVYFVTKVEYEDCTEEQSEQLNELYNLYLQKGVNNIINENESGIGCEMQLEYMQDRNIKYDNDISELRQAIVALGGVV